MGAKYFSHTRRLTMCGLKKLASGVFPESWKVLAATAAAETDPNKSPGYPGWFNYFLRPKHPEAQIIHNRQKDVYFLDGYFVKSIKDFEYVRALFHIYAVILYICSNHV